MHITPFLTFDGDCEAAFTRYAEVLGGKIDVMMTNEDSPMAEQVPADCRGKILYAHLSIGQQTLMGSDVPREKRETPQGFSVTLQIDEAGEAARVFTALAEGGEVTMPLQETFWAERFGTLTDRFGTPWMVNCPGSKAG